MTKPETKRDVFDEVRYKFRNFKNEHRHGMYVSPDPIDHYLSDALKRYYAALPDDLPVIPQAVSEFIKDNKDLDLLVALTIANNGYMHSELWIAMYQDTFARAWALEAWIVAETGEAVKL